MEENENMPFLGHLEELRWRLVKSVIVVVIIAFVVFIFREEIVYNIFLRLKDANFPTLRAGTTSVVLGDRLIVMGGESDTQVPAHSEVEAYDVSDGKWHSLPAMLEGRHGTQAILYKGKVYIAGGSADRGGGPELKSIDCWHLNE